MKAPSYARSPKFRSVTERRLITIADIEKFIASGSMEDAQSVGFRQCLFAFKKNYWVLRSGWEELCPSRRIEKRYLLSLRGRVDKIVRASREHSAKTRSGTEVARPEGSRRVLPAEAVRRALDLIEGAANRPAEVKTERVAIRGATCCTNSRRCPLGSVSSHCSPLAVGPSQD